MNELIETIFSNFVVDGITIPVSFLVYEGHDDAYVTYREQDADRSISGDDELIGYVEFYDFDVYTKGNYIRIIESIKNILKQNDFVFQPSRTSEDMYEEETGYYHKTLNFAIYKEEN